VRIGLISDTHIPSAIPTLWPVVREVFAGVDLILHAGDLHETSVLDWLEEIAPVRCARGNGDWRVVDPRVDETQVLEVEGLRIGMTHGLWFPDGPPLAVEIARVFGQPLDVLVLGDTHVELIEWVDGVLVINPGSATYPHNLRVQPGTVALLTIAQGRPQAELVFLSPPERWRG
jgi:putative phosphoesterase